MQTHLLMQKLPDIDPKKLSGGYIFIIVKRFVARRCQGLATQQKREHPTEFVDLDDQNSLGDKSVAASGPELADANEQLMLVRKDANVLKLEDLNKGEMKIAIFNAGIREKMKYADVPEGMRGLGLVFMITGLMAMAFMAFSGIQL